MGAVVGGAVRAEVRGAVVGGAAEIGAGMVAGRCEGVSAGSGGRWLAGRVVRVVRWSRSEREGAGLPSEFQRPLPVPWDSGAQ